MGSKVDVVVVGGGAAGLSGAVALARFRRSVVLVDAGEPRNAPAGHVHNFLSRDGTSPADLYAEGCREFEGYGGHVQHGWVSALARDGERFRVETNGEEFHARGVLVATGARDELPDVPGLAEQWGKGVVHCPYCHGWEIRDRRIGVLATGPMAVHQALMFRQLSADITYIVHAGHEPTDEAAEQLEALGIPVVGGPALEAESTDGLLTAVRLADGIRIELDALVVTSFPRARTELLEALGVETADLRVGELAVATHIVAGPMGATSVPGVFAAGNVSDPMAQVMSAAAAGLAAAGGLNNHLITADAATAAQRHRDHP